MIKKIVLALIVSSIFLPTFSMATNANINDLKVAYIYNFIRYINWPELDKKREGFHVCVHESSDLQEKLLILESKSVKDNPIKIVPILSEEEDLSMCEVLVLPKLKPQELKRFTDYATPSNILTISDTEGYAKLNVMINLVVLNNKIKFEVNLNEVDSTNLTISSSLLKLAKIVESED